MQIECLYYSLLIVGVSTSDLSSVTCKSGKALLCSVLFPPSFEAAPLAFLVLFSSRYEALGFAPTASLRCERIDALSEVTLCARDKQASFARIHTSPSAVIGRRGDVVAGRTNERLVTRMWQVYSFGLIND